MTKKKFLNTLYFFHTSGACINEQISIHYFSVVVIIVKKKEREREKKQRKRTKKIESKAVSIEIGNRLYRDIVLFFEFSIL